MNIPCWSTEPAFIIPLTLWTWCFLPHQWFLHPLPCKLHAQFEGERNEYKGHLILISTRRYEWNDTTAKITSQVTGRVGYIPVCAEWRWRCWCARKCGCGLPGISRSRIYFSSFCFWQDSENDFKFPDHFQHWWPLVLLIMATPECQSYKSLDAFRWIGTHSSVYDREHLIWLTSNIYLKPILFFLSLC